MATARDQGKIGRNFKLGGLVALSVVALALLGGRADAADPAKMLAPHLAVYDLKLKEATGQTGMTGLTGRMAFEFTGSACEGYTLNMQILTEVALRDGRNNQTNTRTTSWESGDGDTLRFGVWRYMNGKLNENFEGKAERGGKGKPGEVEFKKPKEETADLRSKAIFPIEHMREIMKTAYAGEKILKSEIFDGGDGKKIFSVIAFIGKKRAAGEAKLPDGIEGTDELSKLASWPVSLSYFEINGKKTGEQTPDHITRFDMFENGVSTELTLDYGTFSISGALREIKYLDKTDC